MRVGFLPATLLAALLFAAPLPAQRLPPAAAVPSRLTLAPADTPQAAVVYSDAYGTRLTIHRIGSYAILPLFGAQYLLGRSLLEDDDPADWVKPAHVVVASGVGALFAVNTVTGAWNLWESRREPEGRARRYLHAGLMAAAEAGFVYTATLAGDARLSDANARDHRNAALASMAVSAASTLIMWIWN